MCYLAGIIHEKRNCLVSFPKSASKNMTSGVKQGSPRLRNLFTSLAFLEIFSGMLGESQLSEVASNLSFYTSVPVSPLPKNEGYLEMSKCMVQKSSVMVMK